MKAFTLFVMFYTMNAAAQIGTPVSINQTTTIGRVAPMGAFVAELEYSLAGTDTVYTLSFNDMQYKHINEIKAVSFIGSKDELFHLLMNAFAEKEYKVAVKIGNEQAIISRVKNIGVTQVMIVIGESYVALVEKQVKKLFGM